MRKKRKLFGSTITAISPQPHTVKYFLNSVKFNQIWSVISLSVPNTLSGRLIDLAPFGDKSIKNVITIQIWFDLTSFRKYFSVCMLIVFLFREKKYKIGFARIKLKGGKYIQMNKFLPKA